MGEVQRRLVRDARGVAFDADEGRYDRELRALQNEAVQSRIAPSPMPPPTAEGATSLPSSYKPESQPLPSMRRSMALVGLLIDRAEAGLTEGRRPQARSDLAFAERQLAGLRGASGAKAVDLESLVARLEDVRRRLNLGG